MNIPLDVAKQAGGLLIMAILGYIARLFGVIDKKDTAKLFRLLIYVTYPLLIIVSFGQKFSKDNFNRFGTVFIIALIVHLFATVIAMTMFRRSRRQEAAAYRFCLAFSSAGFVGFPVLKLIFGNLGAFYGASYVLFSSLYMCFIGQFMLSSGRRMPLKERLRMLFNPCLAAAALGFLLFLLHIRLPRFAASALGSVGDMSIPLAMLILGSMARELSPQRLFLTAEAYASAFVKLLALPLAVLALCMMLGISKWTAYICVVMAALPTTVTAPFMAERCGAERSKALICAVLTMILSVITLPIVMYIAKYAF